MSPESQSDEQNRPRPEKPGALNPRRWFNILLNGALIGLLIWYAWNYYGLLYPSTRVDKEAKASVIMYSTKWCPYCLQARAYFAKNKIPYYEYDINQSEDGLDQFLKLGGKGVPLFLLNGKVIHGLRKDRLAETLRIP